MATNFIQPGENITVATPYDRSSGQGVLVGNIFGVALEDADYSDGDDVLIARCGIYELTKVGSQAWSVGDKVYWDDTNKYCTKTSSANIFIGAAVEAVGSGGGATLGKVLLMPGGNPHAVAPSTFVADPSGGGTVDSQARTAIASILDILIAHNLMAAS